MKRILYFLSLSLCLISCKSNEKKEIEVAQLRQTKLDSLVQNQIATIDMNAVDSYPLFETCKDTLNHEQQRECFQKEFSKYFQEFVKSEKLEVTEPISDTVTVYIKVDNKGNVVLDRTESKGNTDRLLPNLDEILIKHFEEFPDLEPAKKQGVEVSIQFAMPLVLKAQ